MSPPARYDVVIIGGGIIGSSIAYWLGSDVDFTSAESSILVVERDPTYADCSTSRSVGAFRQQFSTAENILIGQFGRDFFGRAPQLLRVKDERLDFSVVESGYLFLATESGVPFLEANHRLQRKLDVDVTLLKPDAIAERFPWMNIAGLGAGTLGLTEGWLDPHALMLALRAKAESLGTLYRHDEVTKIQRSGPAVSGVKLRSGDTVDCGTVVNAAGPRAATIAAMAGIRDLPVHPRKRNVYTFHCRESVERCPLVIDPTGVWFRPEAGGRFLCGISPPEDHDPDTLDLHVDLNWFDELIWPTLAHRVPAFDAIKRGNSWAGHYAVNVKDHNAIIGAHPEVRNFLFANGFSGHGVQQSPAVGRAIAELIIHDEYRSLDLSRFAFERFATGELIRELNVI